MNGRTRSLAVALTVAWTAVACTAPAAIETQSPRPTVTAAPSATAAVATPSPAPATTAAATPGPTPSPESTPESLPSSDLDPDLCPPTPPPATVVTPDGIGITGSVDFVAHTQAALALLEEKAPTHYADVVAEVALIRSVESFSGMCYDTGTFRVGTETAYAPGYPLDDQRLWFAGTIVHDAYHRSLFRRDLEPSGRDAELACMERQRDALELMSPDHYFGRYVQGLIDDVDNPASQYWNDPNRHW